MQAEFEIGYSTYARQDASTATSVSLIAPALTPSSGNPAFRILEVDPDSFAVMDYIEVVANLTSPTFQSSPTWLPYYSARETYGGMFFDRPLATHEPLDGPFWHRVTEIFEADDAAFHTFMAHRTRGAVKPKCASVFCKARWIAALRAARSEYNGQDQGMRQPFRKRSLEGSSPAVEHEHEDRPGDHSCSMRLDDTTQILQGISAASKSQVRSFCAWGSRADATLRSCLRHGSSSRRARKCGGRASASIRCCFDDRSAERRRSFHVYELAATVRHSNC
jgi:hypothetical protein